MDHPTHKLKAYMADYKKPLVFCELCGKDAEEGLSNPCEKTFEKVVDLKIDDLHTQFVSGLP